jgi:hypothetical protein
MKKMLVLLFLIGGYAAAQDITSLTMCTAFKCEGLKAHYEPFVVITDSTLRYSVYEHHNDDYVLFYDTLISEGLQNHHYIKSEKFYFVDKGNYMDIVDNIHHFRLSLFNQESIENTS